MRVLMIFDHFFSPLCLLLDFEIFKCTLFDRIKTLF